MIDRSRFGRATIFADLSNPTHSFLLAPRKTSPFHFRRLPAHCLKEVPFAVQLATDPRHDRTACLLPAFQQQEQSNPDATAALTTFIRPVTHF